MNKVYFIETLKIFDLLSARSWRGIVFNNNTSYLFRQLTRIYRPKYFELRSIFDGDLQSSTSIRRISYEDALKESHKRINHLKLPSNSLFLNIDLKHIIIKLLVESLFKKIYFIRMVTQFAIENPYTKCELYIDGDLPDALVVSIDNLVITKRRKIEYLNAFFNLLIIPAYILIFYLRHKVIRKPTLNNYIICQIDGKKSYEMFKNLFGDRSNLAFVIEKRNIVHNFHYEYFQLEEVNNLKIIMHGIDHEDLFRLISVSFGILLIFGANYPKILAYDSFLFDLYEIISWGILQTVNASHSAYLTYEHLFLPNAVRNELLRVKNNISISFPYGTQVESHFFASGYQYNYDILCSSGQLQEEVYTLQQSKTKVMLPIGAYEANQEIIENDNRRFRINRLIDFKDDNILITILSSGIQAETYSGEVRLLQLAKRLSGEVGVKVIIRPKPLPVAERYKDVISTICGTTESILITGPEYQLSDFIEATDLFLTFQSHSAADICALGGSFFCINFMDDDPFSLWQSAVDGIYIHHASAYDIIMAWVKDTPIGQRQSHNIRMSSLRSKLLYRSKNFNHYYSNLQEKLELYLPKSSN
jgi:hypothetical protein